jgi:hypothetical protein
MPLDLHIIRASEFVHLNPQGHFDFEASKEALAVLAQACRKRGVDRALVDLRELPVLARPRFTPSELAALVGTFRQAGFTRRQRLAVLYLSDPHKGARLFTFISIMRGWQVRAFDDFEEALLWLSEEEKRAQRECKGQEVPIQFAKRKATARLTIQDRATA